MFREIFMAIIALLAGAGVSAGVFAFVLVIGIVPRILEYSKMENIILVENVMICGVIAGNISSVASGKMSLPAGTIIIAVYGLCVGIFVGCIAVALAEILHTFPIIFKRMKLRAGLGIIVVSMALGKLAGALYYFITGYMTTA
ncbi:stage V sporulation protein AB [Agathobacter sp.]